MQLDPVQGKRWVLRVAFDECGDGSVVMYLVRRRRGPCGTCGRYSKTLLVPEFSEGRVPLCRVCVVSVMRSVLMQEATRP